MKTDPSEQTGRQEPAHPERRPEVWVIGASEALGRKIEQTLRPLAPQMRMLAPQDGIEADLEGALRESEPPLIVIDIGEDTDWGLRVIQAVKRARSRTATVILTECFSRDFGAKIISEGIDYYFSHDFCRSEFLRLAKSILKPIKDSCRGESRP